MKDSPVDLPYNFFWVNPDVAGSAHPGHTRDSLVATLKGLKEEGIEVIVSLSHLDSDAVSEAGLTHVPLNTPDMGVPDVKQLNGAIDFVQDKLAAGKKILAHCGAGYGRTGTFLACLLVAQGMDSYAAVAMVREKQPGAIETAGQENFIHTWARQCGSRA